MAVHSPHWGRRIANVPRDVLTDVLRTCRRCKKPKAMKGGSIVNHKFTCAECK